MTDLRHATPLTTLVVSAALIVAACGGSTASPSAAASSDVSAAPSVEASPPAAASEGPASEAPSASEVALPSFDLSGLTQNLASVDSYRIAISINGTPSYQAIVVMKPQKAEAITLGNGTDSTRIIKIGDEAWMATGNDRYEVADINMVNGLAGAFDPILLLGIFANGNIGAIANDLGTEQKNGIDAHHYRLDATSSLGGAFALPPGSALEFWVADEGYLVGYEFSGAAADQGISIDVTNVNDPANKVERPS